MSPSYSSLNLVLLGPPGSGKGTQAAALAERYQIPHISTGDMLRNEIERGTELGREAEGSLTRGELVGDRLVAGQVLQRLDAEDCARGFVLDGFPRNADQAAMLDDVLAELGRGLERVVLLELPDEVIVARNQGRLVHPATGRTYHDEFNPPRVSGVDDLSGEKLVRREDDSEEAIRERLRVYHLEARVLTEMYRGRGQLVVVDGNRTVRDVSESVMQAIEAPVAV